MVTAFSFIDWHSALSDDALRSCDNSAFCLSCMNTELSPWRTIIFEKCNSWLANKKIIRRSFTKDMNGRVQKYARGRLTESGDWKTQGHVILLQKYY